MNDLTVSTLQDQITKVRESCASLNDFVEKFVKASGLNGNDIINVPLLFGSQEKTTVVVDGFQLNHDQLRIFNKVMSKLRSSQNDPFHIFVSGAAGTGKTLLLKALRNEIRSMLNEDACMVTTHTFAGAKSIDGATIHSTFSIPVSKPNSSPYQTPQKKNNFMENKMKKLKIVLIDGINFVDAQLFQAIDQKLRAIINTQKPFGGVSIVVFGDLFQMSPINGNPIWKDPSVKNLWNVMQLEELTRNERVSDPDEILMFDVLRSGGNILTQAVVENLKQACAMRGDSVNDVIQELQNLRNQYPDKRFAVLCNTNAIVDKINEQFLQQLGNKKTLYAKDAVKNLRGPTSIYNQTGKSEKMNLEICIGSQVMLTTNYHPYTYGAIGKVMECNEEIITVKFPTGTAQLVRCGWYQRANGWRQFPLALAEAFTFSNCQETMVDGVIVVGEIDKKSVYAVLSRAKSLKLCRFSQIDALDNFAKRDLEPEKEEMRRMNKQIN
ncbi:Protein CBG07262 [Caenorhabditis briggsae]|uniref:ATP-dependent DNA helicase n=2 Tax=Caenorhabditis briggsae TaxID=6238 RepID=A8X541_CAEBR|nr:Protein CBG07262 [Caenorhabditis briggsae]ULT85038.1 hypothetical protein L3Y34_013617 [Caenorhabditis briggsae]CAP27752.2 Protein CBG07262 [Caenorhabditis briggsae]